MLNKILAIGFTLVAASFIAASPTFAKSNNSNHSQDKPTKSEIVFDLPDSGDNLHPSGKDRSVEPGRSLTQGKSKSDPDDNNKGPERSNGKSDKPGSVGGVDKFDQDGNNGCGNDDDFEDDNEGWCGHKPKKDHEEKCEKDCSHDKDKDHDKDDDKNCGKGGSDKEKPKPLVVITEPKTSSTPQTGSVLGISQLPNTANESDSDFSFIWLALAIISTGAGLNLVARKYEKLS